MTETVDQAQAQPPRALAGVIEDATSLSFVSDYASRRIARWPPHVTATRRTRGKPSHRDQLPHTPHPWTLTEVDRDQLRILASLWRYERQQIGQPFPAWLRRVRYWPGAIPTSRLKAVAKENSSA